MSAILKTWPSFMDERKEPQREIEKIYFTHQGVVLGYFDVLGIARNDGSLPKLRSLSNRVSEWQFKPDVYVLTCKPPMHWLEGEKVHHDSFRGWRYFAIDEYRGTLEAKVRL